VRFVDTNVLLYAPGIVAAARGLGCATLLSEDLADGADYGGVHVLNPFAGVR
jgi:predicted nucleic acid-binding protein